MSDIIKIITIVIFVSSLSCSQSPKAIFEPSSGLYKFKPRQAMYTIEYDKSNPNIINIRSDQSNVHTAWIIVDKEGIKSVQLLNTPGEDHVRKSNLVGAFIRKDNKVTRLKGFKTGILAREK